MMGSGMGKRMRWIALGVLIGVLVAGAGTLAAARLVGPRGLADFFFGPHLARAEVILVLNGGQVHDFRIDRGRLRSLPRTGSLELKELDGTVQVIPVAPNAAVTVNGVPASLSALARGMVVTAVRDGSGPAQQVLAEGPRPRAARR
jgi:hypothetical protein